MVLLIYLEGGHAENTKNKLFENLHERVAQTPAFFTYKHYLKSH